MAPPSPPPDLVELADRRRWITQATAASATRLIERTWVRLDPDNIITSWDRVVGPAVLRIVMGGQLAASDGAQDYVLAALDAQGVDGDPAGEVSSTAFAGWASDGRPLESLLRQPAMSALSAVVSGSKVDTALAASLGQLAMMAQTQIGDANRIATGVAMMNDRKVRGYVRHLTPPSCSRCVILAGRWYAANRGFRRHPRCDCVTMPSAEVLKPQDPMKIFERMSPAELKKAGWSAADVNAINDGGDIYQVTNARRKLDSTTIAGRETQVTHVGTTRSRPIRLTPESVYQLAGGDRAEAVRLLRVHGYIT